VKDHWVYPGEKGNFGMWAMALMTGVRVMTFVVDWASEARCLYFRGGWNTVVGAVKVALQAGAADWDWDWEIQWPSLFPKALVVALNWGGARCNDDLWRSRD